MTVRPRGAFVVGLALTLLVMPARAQSPEEVRIDISSGIRRIRIHCEALTPAGDRNPRIPSVQADEVLANDLDHSAVFTVSRGWVAGEQAFDVQGVISGKWESRGGRITLTGEVGDFPARRSIFKRDYRGSSDEWRVLVHQFADDVVQ